jgi:hypothetical protein
MRRSLLVYWKVNTSYTRLTLINCNWKAAADCQQNVNVKMKALCLRSCGRCYMVKFPMKNSCEKGKRQSQGQWIHDSKLPVAIIGWWVFISPDAQIRLPHISELHNSGKLLTSNLVSMDTSIRYTIGFRMFVVAGSLRCLYTICATYSLFVFVFYWCVQ